MTDLSKGIIEINGIVITKNSKPSDFENLPADEVKFQVSKLGHTYIKFLTPLHSNGIDVYVKVTFPKDSDCPEIGLCPSVPDHLAGKYDEIARYMLAASKKWLAGMLHDTPTTDCDEGISYHFDAVSFSSFTYNDIHYGLVGGAIDVTFHEV